MKRRATRALVATACVFVAAIAVAHTPMGRPLLAWMGGSGGGCPVALARATPASLERARVAATEPLRGDSTAKAKPASFGFMLLTSTRADVEAWARETSRTCKEELRGAALRCSSASENGDAFFRFDDRGLLVALDAIQPVVDPDAAVARLDAASASVARVLGVDKAPTIGGADDLAEPLGRATAAYRFRDYVVDLSASHAGPNGLFVREQYRAIP